MSAVSPEMGAQRRRVEAFMREHRTGLLTLLFTDLEDSTALKQKLGDREGVALIQAHHEQVRRILLSYAEAAVVDTAGDSFFIVFTKPSEAVRFALELQRAVCRLAEGLATPLRDRVGIHIGEVVVRERERSGYDLFGIQVDTCARVMALASGGQVLLTLPAFDQARQTLRPGATAGEGSVQWMNHGLYLLKGVEEPVEICEVGVPGFAPLLAPPDSEKSRRHTDSSGDRVLGWRPGICQTVPGTGWELIRKLGEGGFGEVWLGQHRALGEERVFKFCFRADRVRALRREVTIWRRLKERLGSHRQIVPIREVFFEEPPFYLVMDYAAGHDLASWCEAQGGVTAVPISLRLEILAQVVEALGAAQAAGVVHRDVKPGNILVETTPAGAVHVRLTDFGIGQILDPTRAAAGTTPAGFTATLLQPEALTGSQFYTAPELWAGEKGGAAADSFSVGIVLYQLLSGDWRAPMTPDWRQRVHGSAFQEMLANLTASDPAKRPLCGPELAVALRTLVRTQERKVEQAVRVARSDRGWFKLVDAVGWLLITGGLIALAALIPTALPAGLAKILGACTLIAGGLALLIGSDLRFRGGIWGIAGWFTLITVSAIVLSNLNSALESPNATTRAIVVGALIQSAGMLLAALMFAQAWNSHIFRARKLADIFRDLPAGVLADSNPSAGGEPICRRSIWVNAATIAGLMGLSATFAVIGHSTSYVPWVWLALFLCLTAAAEIGIPAIDSGRGQVPGLSIAKLKNAAPSWLPHAWPRAVGVIVLSAIVGLIAPLEGGGSVRVLFAGIACSAALWSIGLVVERRGSPIAWLYSGIRSWRRARPVASSSPPPAAGRVARSAAVATAVKRHGREFLAVCAGVAGAAAVALSNPWLVLSSWLLALGAARGHGGRVSIIHGVGWLALGALNWIGSPSANFFDELDSLLLHGIVFALPGLTLIASGWRLSAEGRAGRTAAPPRSGAQPVDAGQPAPGWAQAFRTFFGPVRLTDLDSRPAAPNRVRLALRKAAGFCVITLGACGVAAVLLGHATEWLRGAPYGQLAGFAVLGITGIVVLLISAIPSPSLEWAAVGLLLAGWGIAKGLIGIAEWPTVDVRSALTGLVYLAAGAAAIWRGRGALAQWRQAGVNSGADVQGGNPARGLLGWPGRTARWSALVLVALGVVYYAWENRQGRRVWQGVEAALFAGSAPDWDGIAAQFSAPRKASGKAMAGSWIQPHLLYRPGRSIENESALLLVGRGIRRELRRAGERSSQGATTAAADETQESLVTDEAPLGDVLALLARVSGLMLFSESGVDQLSITVKPLRWSGATALKAFDALAAHHNLNWTMASSGRSLRLLPKRSPELGSVGGVSWLVGDCKVPRWHREFVPSTPLELIRKLRREDAPVGQRASDFRGFPEFMPLPQVIIALARDAKINALVDPAVPANTLIRVFAGGDGASPEQTLADLIELFALGAAWDPVGGLFVILSRPLVPPVEMAELFLPHESSLGRFRETALHATRSVAYDWRGDYCGDFFMGPQVLAPKVFHSMIAALQAHANLRLWENRPAEAMADLEGIAGLIEHALRIPVLETWPLLLEAAEAYCDVALGGFTLERWRAEHVAAIARALESLDLQKEFERRFSAEMARAQAVLTRFPRVLIVPTLSQLDRNAEAQSSSADRLRLGFLTLVTLVCPRGWIEQNLAASVTGLERLRGQALRAHALKEPQPAVPAVAAAAARRPASHRSPERVGMRARPHRFLAEFCVETAARRLGDAGLQPRVQAALEEVRRRCADAPRPNEAAR